MYCSLYMYDWVSTFINLINTSPIALRCFDENQHNIVFIFFSIGKACSHAAALAYKVDAVRRFDDTASTSLLSAWNDMSKKKVNI